jgi:quercetin dioxygenase-like cupin family protein
MSGVRRVVTGHRGDGKAIIKLDRIFEPQPVPSGDAAFAKLWVTQTSPADNTAERDGAELPSGLTCMDGTVLRVVDFQPGKVSPMHKTNSVDYGIVLWGEMEMRLDGGEATRLKAGDIVIQRGTNHAWANVGTAPARMVFALIDALPLGDGSGVTP